MSAKDVYSGVAIASLGEAMRAKGNVERTKALIELDEESDQAWREYVSRKKREAAQAFASDDARDQVVGAMLDEVERAAAEGNGMIDASKLRLSRRENRQLRLEMHGLSEQVKLVQRIRNQGLEPTPEELRAAAEAEEQLARLRQELNLPPKQA